MSQWLRIVVMMLLGWMLAGESLAQSSPRPPAPPVSRPQPPRGVPAPKARPAPVAAPVTLEVLVVHATSDHERVDPRLAEMRARLSHIAFTGFSVIDEHEVRIAPGEDSGITVTGGRRLRVELVERNNTSATVRFQLFKGEKKTMDTTVSIKRNRSFIIAGPKHDGGVLMLPLSVRY
jgi:hypothetical protein